MSASAAQLITRRCAERNNGPIEESTTIYRGTLCFINANGYVDDDVAAGVNKFAGVAVEDYDNSSGADGDLQAEFFTEGLFQLEGSGFTQGTVGSDIYASDNFTVGTSSSGTTYVGRCAGFISTTKIWVRIDLNNEPGNLSAVDVDDDEDVLLGTGDDAALLWSTGDADNHTLVIGLGDSNQALHITDKTARDTDWAVAADTHPTLYVHSNTTPTTDYLKIGAHDGTTGHVEAVGGSLNLTAVGEVVVNEASGDVDFRVETNGQANAFVVDAGDDAVYIKGDDVPLAFGAGTDVQLLWSTGDADNHTAVLALGNSSQSLHITDVGAKATDWNVAADTHPNVYIHSNTTPATDYLRLGDHDGTTADIDVVGGTTLSLQIAGSQAVGLTATAMTFAATCFPVLPITDTDGTVEGSLWYDASEDKLKFKTAAGVETITSS